MVTCWNHSDAWCKSGKKTTLLCSVQNAIHWHLQKHLNDDAPRKFDFPQGKIWTRNIVPALSKSGDVGHTQSLPFNNCFVLRTDHLLIKAAWYRAAGGSQTLFTWSSVIMHTVVCHVSIEIDTATTRGPNQTKQFAWTWRIFVFQPDVMNTNTLNLFASSVLAAEEHHSSVSEHCGLLHLLCNWHLTAQRY